jgi:hypothetical protein
MRSDSIFNLTQSRFVVELTSELAMWTEAIVSAWSDDGHMHSTGHSEAAVPGVGREAADCRRDFGGGGVGSVGGANARSQRQPGFQLAQAVSSRTTGRIRHSQTVAGQSKQWVMRRGSHFSRFLGRHNYDTMLLLTEVALSVIN